MPRPNHDIPNLLLGGIRDYADEEGMDHETAHAALLRIALKHVGILGCSSTEAPSEGGAGVSGGKEVNSDGSDT